MTLSQARWHVIAESNFAWEREALDWLRSHLPDRDPLHVWTNFEFIDEEGKCRRRFNFEPPCRLNIEPGMEADVEVVGCG